MYLSYFHLIDINVVNCFFYFLVFNAAFDNISVKSIILKSFFLNFNFNFNLKVAGQTVFRSI